MVRSVGVRSPSLAPAAPGLGVSPSGPPLARPLVPRAAVLARPLQHLEVAAKRRDTRASTSFHGQPFARAHFSSSRWPPSDAASPHVSSSHGQSFSRAHFSTSRWPPSAAHTRVLVPRAVVLARPLQHLEVAAQRRLLARVLVPRAAVLARPLQFSSWPPCAAAQHVSSFHGQPFSRAHCSTSRWPRHAASLHVRSSHGQPRARPLERLEVAALRRAAHVSSFHGQPFPRAHFSTSRWPPSAASRARLLVPRAVVLARPFQHLEVAALRSERARQRIPGATFRASPPQKLEASPPSAAPAQVLSSKTHPFSRATSAPRGGRTLPRSSTSAVPQAFSRVHFNSSSCPLLAASRPGRLLFCRTPRVCLSFSKLTFPSCASFNIRQLLYLTPRRVHGVPRVGTHRAEAGRGPRAPGEVRSEGMCVEITSRGRLEKPPGASAVSTAVSWCCFDVSEVIVDGEVRVVSVSCVVRACVCAATRSEVEAFNFSSDVTTSGDVTCLRYHVRFETTRGPVYHARS